MIAQVAEKEEMMVTKHLHLVHDVENKAVWFKVSLYRTSSLICNQ